MKMLSHPVYIANDANEKKRIRRILSEQGLTSYMNDTKWRELCLGIAELPFPPSYQVKLVGQDLPSSELEYAPPSGGDWGQTPEGAVGFHIEWAKISPRMSLHRGMLVSPEIIDCSEELRALMRRLRLPFVEDGDYFTLYGHGSGIDFDALA